MPNTIDVVVVASTAQAEASLKRVGATAEGSLGASGPLGKASKEAESGLSKAGKGAGNFLTGLTGLSPAMLGAAAIGGGLSLMADGVFKAFEENEKATINLENEMRNAGEKVTPAFTKALQSAQTAGENLGFSQSDTTKTMGALTLAGLTSAQAFKQLPVIMDFARAKSISMTDATLIFAKGIAGSGKALKDMNIIGLMTLPTTAAIAAAHVKLAADLAKGAKGAAAAKAEQEKLNTTLSIAYVRAHNLTIMHDGLAKKVGGAATGATKTLGVQWQIVTARFNALAGQAMPVVLAGISALTGVLSFLIQHLDIIGPLVGGVAAAFLAWAIATKGQAAVTGILTGVQGALNAVMDANPLMLVVIAIGLLVAGFVIAYTHVKGFRDIVQSVFHVVVSIIQGAVGVIAGVFKTLANVWLAPWDILITAINFIISLLDKVHFNIQIPGWVPLIGGKGFQLGFSIPQIPIPHLAAGAIVMPTPGGSLVRVAEAGKPEAIVPLTPNLARSGGGGDTYNINTNVASPADPNAISRAVVFSLRSRSRASLAIA